MDRDSAEPSVYQNDIDLQDEEDGPYTLASEEPESDEDDEMYEYEEEEDEDGDGDEDEDGDERLEEDDEDGNVVDENGNVRFRIVHDDAESDHVIGGGDIRFRIVHEDEESEDDRTNRPTRHFLTLPGGMPFRVEILGLMGGRRRRDPHRHLIPGAEEVPSKEGMELMKSGEFGAEEIGPFSRRPGHHDESKRPLASRLLLREIGAYREKSRIGNQLLAQTMLPSSKADFILQHSSNVYSGQFSQDGNIFYSCSQDFRVRMYDTSNPYDWKHFKAVVYPGGRWTITDATLSPDNKMLAYSSIAPVVYASNTIPGVEETWELNFSAGRPHNRNAMDMNYGIWSIRFSGDGRELIAGANDSNLYVYDIERQTPILKLSGHEDDVNAVCFADITSPHILFSGSDDTTIKIWDRRSMASGREVGVFVGHLEGLTYIDSKGDGRYVLSNGKDQTMKLWDIRKMMDPAKFDSLKDHSYSCGFDYRHQEYDLPPSRHPQDCSVVTYRGHRVLRTLIRCHFSPPVSSGNRYVYTGSADGKVYIYNLDATLAAVIDVREAMAEAYGGDVGGGRRTRRGGGGGRWDWDGDDRNWGTCVRDASWHPNAGVLAATSWSERMGSVTVHTWGGGEDGEVKRLNALAWRMVGSGRGVRLSGPIY